MKNDINNFQLSTNFNLKEFRCRGKNCCGGTVKISSELVGICEELRGNSELIITSSYRCPVHNKREGGAINSYHIQGLAADLKPKRPLEELYLSAASHPSVGGCGIYTSGIVHIDLRTGPRVFWVSWTFQKRKLYRYFSNPGSALEYYKIKIKGS